MNEWIKAEYFRLRHEGWAASCAWRAAKVKDAWEDAEAEGLVRLGADPDECTYIEDLDPDGTPEQRAETMRRANRDGVWVFYTEYLDPVHGWVVADSIGGVLGDDFEDSGYDTDLRENALDALNAIDPKLCQGWC